MTALSLNRCNRKLYLLQKQTYVFYEGWVVSDVGTSKSEPSLNSLERNQSAGIEFKSLDGLKYIKLLTYKVEV